MTTFRQYRQQMADGSEPSHEVSPLPSDAVEFQGERAGFVSRAIAAGIDVAVLSHTAPAPEFPEGVDAREVQDVVFRAEMLED